MSTLTAREALCYEEHVKDQELHQGPTGSFIVDLDHWPHHNKGCALLPCLVRHGKIVDVPSEEVLTPQEHLFAVGENCILRPHVSCSMLPCFFQDHLEELSGYAMKQIAGNAMDTMSACPLLFYALCNIEIKGDAI